GSCLVAKGRAAPGRGASQTGVSYSKPGIRSMAAFRIAVIGGDGIGPEVIDQAVQVADAALRHEAGARVEWNRLPWSSATYKQTGRMMPPDGWDLLKKHDAILFGAIGSPDAPDHIPLHAPL